MKSLEQIREEAKHNIQSRIQAQQQNTQPNATSQSPNPSLQIAQKPTFEYQPGAGRSAARRDLPADEDEEMKDEGQEEAQEQDDNKLIEEYID